MAAVTPAKEDHSEVIAFSMAASLASAVSFRTPVNPGLAATPQTKRGSMATQPSAITALASTFRAGVNDRVVTDGRPQDDQRDVDRGDAALEVEGRVRGDGGDCVQGHGYLMW